MNLCFTAARINATIYLLISIQILLIHLVAMSFRIFVILISLGFMTLPASAAKSTALKRLGHAIQMGAFADVNNAERFTNKLQAKGIEAFYFRKDNGIYAVRFGDFPSKNRARAVADKLVASHMIDSYYIAPPSEIVFIHPKETGIEKSAQAEDRNSHEPLHPVVPKETPEKAPSKPVRKNSDMGTIAARTAERFVGIPYRWGGDNVVEGMDCSGFVRAVYNLCGLSIPRTSRDQYRAGDAVSKNDLQDGDLVFFGASADKINHVGIYVGAGKFVHAPRRGEDIRVASVDDNYFDKRFVGARRYF